MTRKTRHKLQARARQSRLGGAYAAHLNQARGTSDQRGPTVRDHLSRIIRLGRAHHAAYEAWRAAEPDVLKSEIRSLAMRAEDVGDDVPGDAECRAHLEHTRRLRDGLLALPEDVLRKVQAVMYVGRDDDDYDVLLRILRRETHKVRALTVAAKLPLVEYLVDGIRLIDEQGIDLERPLLPA